MTENILVTWSEVFRQSLYSVWGSFIEVTPKLVLAIVLFIVGWFLGSLVSKAIEQVFHSLKIDGLFSSIGADSFMRRAGMNLNTGHFVGEVVRWFVIIVFLLPSLNLVGLYDVSYFLRSDVLGYLPQVIVAAFVLIIAAVVAEALGRAVVATAKSMNLRVAHMLGSIAKYAVWIFAVIVALSTLGVATYYMSALFTAIVAMLALAGGLAFGLGGKEHASRLLSRLGEEVSER